MKVIVWLLLAVALAGVVYCFSTCRREVSEGRVEIILFDYIQYLRLNSDRIALFERENPDITVRLVMGYEDKLLTMVAGGVAPDVAYAGREEMIYYAKRDAVLPLDKFIENDKEFGLDDYFSCTVDNVRYRGRIYGVPDTGSPVALIYNKELFDQYNREHPDKPLDYPSEKWTWDDFRHAARELTQDRDADGQTDVYGTMLSFYRNRFPIFVWQNGGEVISKNKKRCLMDSPEAIGAIRWLYEIMWVDKSSPTFYTEIPGVSEQSGGNYFTEQRIAMMMTTRYSQCTLKKATKFEWDIAPLPKGPAGRTNLYVGGQWLVFSQTQHPQQAWRLAKFLAGDKSSEMSMRFGRALVANRAVAERMLRHPGVSPAHDHVWVDIMGDCRFKDFQFMDMGRHFTKATEEMQYVAQGLRMPEQACRNFTRIFQEGLDILWEEEGGP